MQVYIGTKYFMLTYNTVNLTSGDTMEEFVQVCIGTTYFMLTYNAVNLTSGDTKAIKIVQVCLV